jgi:sugar phosphate isomerase/epimerase
MDFVTRRNVVELLGIGLPIALAAGMMPLPAKAELKRTLGVRLGCISFSFTQDMPKAPGGDRVDNLIAAMKSLGITDLEIMPVDLTPDTIEPVRRPAPPTPGAPRTAPAGGGEPRWTSPQVQRWWAETPLSHFEAIRRKFHDNGLNIDCFMGNTWQTEAELDHDFEIAKALGARYLGRPAGIERITKMARAAERHKFPIYVHNETEDEAYLLAAMAVSPIVHINFDTGNYTASGGVNHLEFIQKHHARISHFHLKDRKKNGEVVLYGQGDVPLTQILQLVQRTHWDIGVFMEYEVGLREEYREGRPLREPTLEGARKCIQWAKQVLAQGEHRT